MNDVLRVVPSLAQDDSDAAPSSSFDECSSAVLSIARSAFQQGPSWVSFFREVLGIGGLVSRTFPAPSDRAAFEQTEAWLAIQGMLAELRRQRRLFDSDSFEPQRIITVRLPKALHESLKIEAHRLRTSLNVLAISKLLQAIEADLVPSDF